MHSLSRIARRLSVAAVAIALPAAMLSGCSNANNELVIFHASSARVVMDELSQQLEGVITEQLVFNSAGSQTLVQQIEEGAPADMLITADEKSMKQAVELGLVDSPRTLATNELVLVVPIDNPAGIASFEDLKKATHVVMCDASVPCGRATKKLLEENHVQVDASSLEQQVADVLGKVAAGEADAGFVYGSDARNNGSVRAIEIPGAKDSPNTLMGAVTVDSAKPEQAEKVLDVLENNFDPTWEKHGFRPAH